MGAAMEGAAGGSLITYHILNQAGVFILYRVIAPVLTDKFHSRRHYTGAHRPGALRR